MTFEGSASISSGTFIIRTNASCKKINTDECIYTYSIYSYNLASALKIDLAVGRFYFYFYVYF